MSSRWLAAVNAVVLLAALLAAGAVEPVANGAPPVAAAAAAQAPAPPVAEQAAPVEPLVTAAPVPSASAAASPAPPAAPATSTPPPAPTTQPPPPPPPLPRTASRTDWRPYASVGPVVLFAPGQVVEVVGYHQSGHDGALPQQPASSAPRSLLLESRGRDTSPQGATDVVVDPAREVRSPVTGTVVRAGSYALYCDSTDHYLVVEPDARPGWEVKVLHFEGLQVAAGQRVEAGVTVVGTRARVLPFRSQVDDHTAEPHWPHVHVEVVDPSIPDRRTGPGCP